MAVGRRRGQQSRIDDGERGLNADDARRIVLSFSPSLPRKQHVVGCSEGRSSPKGNSEQRQRQAEQAHDDSEGRGPSRVRQRR